LISSLLINNVATKSYVFGRQVRHQIRSLSSLSELSTTSAALCDNL